MHQLVTVVLSYQEYLAGSLQADADLAFGCECFAEWKHVPKFFQASQNLAIGKRKHETATAFSSVLNEVHSENGKRGESFRRGETIP